MHRILFRKLLSKNSCLAGSMICNKQTWVSACLAHSHPTPCDFLHWFLSPLVVSLATSALILVTSCTDTCHLLLYAPLLLAPNLANACTNLITSCSKLALNSVTSCSDTCCVLLLLRCWRVASGSGCRQAQVRRQASTLIRGTAGW